MRAASNRARLFGAQRPASGGWLIARQCLRRTMGRKSVNQVIIPAGIRNSSETGRVKPTSRQMIPKPPKPSQPNSR